GRRTDCRRRPTWRFASAPTRRPATQVLGGFPLLSWSCSSPESAPVSPSRLWVSPPSWKLVSLPSFLRPILAAQMELFQLLAAHLHDRRLFSVVRHYEHLDGHGFYAVVGDPPEEFRLSANGADVFAAEREDAAGPVGLARVAFGGVGHVVEPDARVLFL